MKISGWILSAALSLAALPALAGDATVGDITISQAWARASAGKVANGAAFLTIVNKGTAADSLVSASSDLSASTELHTHIMEGEVMKMRAVESIAVPASGTAALKPGGDHVMFMGLKAPLKQGDSFPLTLTFAKAGTVKVTVEVQGVGAMGASMGNMPMGGQMNHGAMKH